MSTTSYRCYFTDEGDRIQAVEQIECDDDAGAALKAEHLLAQSKFRSAELWQGTRLVGKWGYGKGGAATAADRPAQGAEPILDPVLA